MRPLLVIVLSSACLGIVWGYASFAEWLKPPPPKYIVKRAEGIFSARIQLSYDQSDNPISKNENGSEKYLTVKLNGTTVHSVTEPIHSKQEIVVDNLNVGVGGNRIFVNAKSIDVSDEQRQKNAQAFLLDESSSDPPSILCVRVQIFRDGIRIDGADFTAHADGQETIILDEPFNVVANEFHEHNH